MARLPRGIKNCNPGNLRLPASDTRPGYIGSDKDGFGKFSAPEFGLDSLARQLVNYGRVGFDTIAAIMQRWAPPGENNTAAYVLYVAGRMKTDPMAPLDMQSADIIAALMTGIIFFENGRQPYTRTMLFNSAQKAVSGRKKT